MRKIEQMMIAAVVAGAPTWRDGNTEVTTDADGTRHVRLHGSEIAAFPAPSPHGPPKFYFDLCGYNTVTTRGRLRALIHAFAPRGTFLYVHKGQPGLMETNAAGQPASHDIPTDGAVAVALDPTRPDAGALLSSQRAGGAA